MRQLPATKWLLLGYLVLFLNLGPAWHRAPIFGLHGSEETHSACSCGFEHGHSTAPIPQQQEIERQLCDCSLCHFFKYNQLDHVSPSVNFIVDRSIHHDEFDWSAVSAESISQRARAPPIA